MEFTFPKILAILYAEFDSTQGPKVLFEVPEGFASSKESSLSVDFDSISEYIIPKSELCNRQVTISTTQFKIMGHPVQILDGKYERNAIIFNICFVFDKDQDTICYEQIVTKIARVLQSLEVESQFLSSSRKQSLRNYIAQIMEDLNSYNECQINIDEVNTLDLKLFPNHPEPPIIYDYQVPILVTDLAKHMDRHWDLTIQKVLNIDDKMIGFINGVNCVSRIATLAKIDLVYIRLAVRHLCYYSCVKLIDIFQFSNMYAATAKINLIIGDQELQESCRAIVSRDGMAKPSFNLICKLYCALNGNLTIFEWISDHESIMSQIDIRKFVAFGVLNGILLRIHVFPILLSQIDSQIPMSIARRLNGQHHLDDLSTKFHMGSTKLQEILNNSAVQYIYK